jgi:cellulose synthase/poly-beta-1,6-N-acetylglucosamine synthase-like glycosyltransferase
MVAAYKDGGVVEARGSESLADVGMVAIGRNEGERLRRCLDSMPRGVCRVVYVDSGSTDNSVALAKERGAEVVELDMSIPFSAARARNAGFARLLEVAPQANLVHFVDGDCELLPGWVDAAVAALRASPGVVAVCGWRRERYPERSPFNTICDVEWRSGPLGETPNFGGDVLMQVSALRAAGGYNEEVIAAEDDELAVRLRRAGGRLLRIDRESTVHDADMTRLRQWWKRATRCGHGYAQVSSLHGAPPDRYFVRESRRVWVWGLAVPALATGLALPTLGLSLWLLGAYPVQAWRTFRGTQRRGFTTRESAYWGLSCTASKFPESIGMIKFLTGKLTHRRPHIIEYKK